MLAHCDAAVLRKSPQVHEKAFPNLIKEVAAALAVRSSLPTLLLLGHWAESDMCLLLRFCLQLEDLFLEPVNFSVLFFDFLLTGTLLGCFVLLELLLEFFLTFLLHIVQIGKGLFSL